MLQCSIMTGRRFPLAAIFASALVTACTTIVGLDGTYSAAPTPEQKAFIDGFESGNGQLNGVDGRTGHWQTFNDGSPGAMVNPGPPPLFIPDRPGHTGVYAAHLSGMGFTSWGCATEVSFIDLVGGKKQPYDASAYKGVTFWAKRGAGVLDTARLNIVDRHTDPDGGYCKSGCYDHYGINLVLSTTWAQYTYAWGDLAQIGWGEKGPITGPDPSALFSFQVHFDGGAAGPAFDFWIDDISFTR